MSFNTVDYIAFFTFSVTDVFNLTTELIKLIEYIHTYIHTYIYLNYYYLFIYLFTIYLTARSRTQRQTDGQTNIEKYSTEKHKN